MPALDADSFIAHLEQEPATPDKNAHLASGKDDVVLGVRMKTIFDLAKANKGMPLDQVERLLESSIHEARVGAVSVMDFKARRKRITPEERKELFDLYLRRHDRIDTWDLVDRSAPRVVGSYLAESGEPRDLLYDLARSSHSIERRTAIMATYGFMIRGELDETFAIAEILVDDEDVLVNKPVGSLLRDAGKRDLGRLRAFLDDHAATMPRVTLRYALEKFDSNEKKRYMGLAKG